MTGDLLAGALVRDQGREAVAIPSINLLGELEASHVDLVVIAADVNSEPGSGFELAHTVNRAYPDISMIVLLNSSNYETVIRAFRSGARGVFSRQQPMSEFVDCVAHVSKGFIWAGRQETDHLRRVFQKISDPSSFLSMDSSALTARELQVVRLAATGITNKAIARELALSEHTVKNYLFRAFDKLGVSNRVELLFYLTTRGHNLGPPVAA